MLTVQVLAWTLACACAAQSAPQQNLLAPLIVKRDASARSSAKDWVAAERLWKRAAELNATDPTAWLELGRARYYLKKYKEAIGALQRADNLGVSYPWDMPYFQACCYALDGNSKMALASLKKSIDLGFRDLALARTDEDLKSLHGSKQFHELVADEDVSKLSRTAGITHDIRYFQREVKRLSYRERNMGGTKIDKLADKLILDVPRLTENQVLVRLMQMAAQVGDGHTHLWPAKAPADGLPIYMAAFAEGIFVTATTPQYKELLGAKVVSIGSQPVQKVLAACATLFGQDNTQWILAQGPSYMRHLRALNGLGITPSDKGALMKFEKNGKSIVMTLPGESGSFDKTWVKAIDAFKGAPALTFMKPEEPFWYEYLPETKTVYFQYNAVSDGKTKTIEQFADELFGFIEANPVDRLIVDIRRNGGGNNFLNQPLLLGLIKSKVNAKGKLFVIIGKSTFSAAMCFAEQVERYTQAMFAGEPTGSSPNFIGESIRVELPYTHMSGTISDLYWQNSVAMDHRKWICPAIYVPSTFAAYIKQQDPAFDAIMQYIPPGK